MSTRIHTNCPNCGAVLPPARGNQERVCNFCTTSFAGNPETPQSARTEPEPGKPPVQERKEPGDIIKSVNGEFPYFKFCKYILIVNTGIFIFFYVYIILAANNAINPGKLGLSMLFSFSILVALFLLVIYIFPLISLQKKYKEALQSGGHAMVHPNRALCMYLCALLGFLGIHRFYIKKIISGIIYIVTLGFLGIGVLADMVLLIFGKFKGPDGNYLN